MVSVILLLVVIVADIAISNGVPIVIHKMRKKKEKIEVMLEREKSRSYASYSKIEEYEEKIKKIEKKLQPMEKVETNLKKAKLPVWLSMILLITIFSSIYFVGEQKCAIVTTFGKAEAVSDAGIHFKIPYIQKVKKLNSTIQGIAIGYQVEDNKSESEDSLMITNDYNLVNVDFYVEYRISDPIAYEYGSSDPVGTLENFARSSIRNTIGRYNVDSVLTTGKGEIQSVVKEEISKKLNDTNIGLVLINITIQDAEPPTEEVSQAFKNVETAKQDAETKKNEAEKYQNEQIPNAEANADEIIKNAKATKQERINEATGEVALFNAMFAEYKKDKDMSKMRIYYETMEEMMPNLKIIVNGTDSEIKPIIIQEDK